jgi:TonB family protein
MPLALLLSPDDQAVSAITGVLEEMSVTCERPLDGVSAAQKLSSQNFDLVLVDCENLPAAKLIFDVCRRGKNGHNPVPIAIVDGRAGLPTAFRLGAELILTKPVAKDQARTTIRTAVSRLKKDIPVVESSSADVANDAFNVRPEENLGETNADGKKLGDDNLDLGAAVAARFGAMSSERISGFAPPVMPLPATAAANDSPQLTSFADASGFASSAAAKASGSGSAAAVKPAFEAPAEMSATSSDSEAKTEAKTTGAKKTQAKKENRPAIAMKPSDDPVLAELERTELEEQEQSKIVKPQRAEPAIVASTKSRSRHIRPRQKGALIGTLMLALAGGGFYAAWTYQPEFRAMAKPQVDRVLALGGMALPPSPKSNSNLVVALPVEPKAQPVAAASRANAATALPGQPASSASAADAASAVATVPVETRATATDTSNAHPDSEKSVAAKSGENKIADAKVVDPKLVDAKLADSNEEASPISSDGATANAQGKTSQESTAVILSSQGAEKRLVHSVAPKYPVQARSRGAQGTIVLKTLVDASGKVANVRLVEGDATLATAAMDAVKQWRYRPYQRGGKMQPFQTVVIVDFQRP